MSKEQTEKSRFKSRYAPNTFVTSAQYIVEFVCENKARSLGKDLPHHFWQLSEWQKYFVSQTKAVNLLLRNYSSKAIIAILRKNPRINSLRAKWVHNLIAQEQKIIDSVQPPEGKIIVVATKTESPRKEFSQKKSILSKLDNF